MEDLNHYLEKKETRVKVHPIWLPESATATHNIFIGKHTVYDEHIFKFDIDTWSIMQMYTYRIGTSFVLIFCTRSITTIKNI